LAPVAGVRDVDADGVLCRLYYRIQPSTAVLVWLHGGGWMVGSIDEHDELCRALAHQAGCNVLSVDYRLAPEHTYPAAVQDAWRATEWAATRYRRIAVGGDSAGGNLAAVTALRARDAGLPLAVQLLIYPVLEHRPHHPTYREFADRYAGFNGVDDYGTYICSLIGDCWQRYIPDPTQRAAPDASPLGAASHHNLAPAHILVAEHDLLRPEAIEYAQRLRSCGVHTQLDYVAGQVHGFYPLIGLLDDARRAVTRSAQALSAALSHTDHAAPPNTSPPGASMTPP
jgi:acetyl esterase